jgi:hypothetical protein
MWVPKSHSLSALGQWEKALAALGSAEQTGEIDAEGRARLAMHQGYLMGWLSCASYYVGNPLPPVGPQAKAEPRVELSPSAATVDRWWWRRWRNRLH